LFQKAIDTAQSELRRTTSSAKRRRLLGIIDRSTRAQGPIDRQIVRCEAKFTEDYNNNFKYCVDNFPRPRKPGEVVPEGAPGHPPGSGKCTAGAEIQCGDICCNATGHPECCFCTKTGMYTCCASGSNCGCCGAP
jgi:hypothetical protein